MDIGGAGFARRGFRNVGGCKKGRSAEKWIWKMSNRSCHTAGVSRRGSRASSNGRGLSLWRTRGLGKTLVWVARLLRFLWRLSGSAREPSGRGTLATRLSLEREPGGTGGGYEHSRPEFSHARQVVPMPLLTHFTFERRQRTQAILERMRPCAAFGDAASGLWLSGWGTLWW